MSDFSAQSKLDIACIYLLLKNNYDKHKLMFWVVKTLQKTFHNGYSYTQLSVRLENYLGIQIFIYITFH